MGIRLRRVDLGVAAGGEPMGLEGVLAELRHRARPSYAARLVGRDVHRALAWEWRDRYGTDWYPQGISGSWDASDDGLVSGRELLAVSWYSRRGHGSRVTFLDLATLRYQHVRLVHTDLRPLQVHAGGLVWLGPYLHVAATAHGFFSCRIDDIVRVDGDPVLPVRYAHRSEADAGERRMRYSFLSLDRSGTPAILAGEYGRRMPVRFVSYRVDPVTSLPACDEDDVSRPEMVDDRGVERMQGVAVAQGTWFATSSRGYLTPGSMYVGRPGAFTERRLSLPWGPEDLSGPVHGELWSLSEHPWGRWVWAVKAHQARK